LGIEIDHELFAEADYERFKQRLRHEVVALQRVLERPGFGEGETTIGTELELFLIDREGRPLPVSREVVAATGTPLVTPEMGAFDIELSTPPVLLEGRPFSELREHMELALQIIRQGAARFGARIVPISILPTFRRDDFDANAITDLPRYRALAAGLNRLRKTPFRICIDGEEPLALMSGDVAMEAANTAFQVHLRVAPGQFARVFNAAMLMTAPVLAAAGNSPTFLGHRLWHETRVALFKQAGDDRTPEEAATFLRPPRIGFATGWVRAGAAELFMESVALHEPILPVCGEEDAIACVEAGGLPKLDDLRLHHGTVWNWNRPVYDPADGGHLRVELRALPSGPSVDDMLANAAYLLGGILALASRMDEILPAFPFALAERNFYRAAQHGLDAELIWPTHPHAPPEPILARDLALALLPLVAEGLDQAGVAASEARQYLDIFSERVRSRVTGATWQRRTLDTLQARSGDRDKALRDMLEHYVAGFELRQPVSTWPIPV
jgi:gamma-glutamyl:cysteine ligase YbdK (ATP-grasp superfamily)